MQIIGFKSENAKKTKHELARSIRVPMEIYFARGSALVASDTRIIIFRGLREYSAGFKKKFQKVRYRQSRIFFD